MGYNLLHNAMAQGMAKPTLSRVSIVFVWLIMSVASQGSDDMRKGHMKPLGYQAGGMHPADETITVPGSQEFYDNYVKKVKPLVFRGAAKIFPAFSKWTDSYLKQEFADLEFRIERKKNLGYIFAPIGDISLSKDTLKNFINTYHNDNKFLISSLPTPMWKDVFVLPCLTCGSFQNRILHMDIWMSGGGTSTTLHRDKFQKIQCLINGTKEWKWVALDHQDKIYKGDEDKNMQTGFSRFDPDYVNLDKFPNISKVSVIFANLNPGDCVYVPQKMYHHVKSYGPMNIAVNTQFSLFKYDKKLNFSNCDAANIKYQSPLKLNVDWPFAGKGMLTFLYPDLNDVKVKLVQRLKRQGENFQRSLMYSLANKHGERNITQGAQEIVDIIRNKSKDEIIRARQILSLPKRKLRRIAVILNDIIPQNTNESEFYMINQFDIATLLSVLSKRLGGMIKKDDFVKMYTEHFKGTNLFGERCFDAMASADNSVITREEIRLNFSNCASKYLADIGIHRNEEENELLVKFNYKPETEYLNIKMPLKGARDTELFDALVQQIKDLFEHEINKLKMEVESYLNRSETDAKTTFENKISPAEPTIVRGTDKEQFAEQTGHGSSIREEL